jgi:hydrogenase nickel incorporation protein HypA/HybF
MHELAVCQALLDQVEQIGAREQAACITSITLRIGPLAGVEPELLIDAFPIAAAGTIAEGALLSIEHLPVRVRCTSCHAESDATPNRLLCASCGDFRTQLISGDELLLASMELERRASAG